MFVSMLFPVFLGAVVTLFFCLPKKWRPAILLLASYVFCGWIELRAVAVLILVSACTWLAGIRIEKKRLEGRKTGSKNLAVFIVGFYILVLCLYKYGIYFINWIGVEQQVSEGVLNSLLIPAGLSFYLFQAIGYLVDIYKGVSCAERNFLHLSCYIAFFPKLVSGPIEREQGFLNEIRELGKVKFWDRGRLSTAFTYMLWGYFMKLVVADRLAVTVNRIFADPKAFDSLWLLLGAFFYTLQIYCDFAGYSYIAIGCARIFGIHLTHNFEAPYCAKGISDFWRRWHISLSSWLRDYLYIPLGGNRKGIVRKCINTMIVFLVCGMWHGAGFHFIAWGLLHGGYSVLETIWRKKGWKVKGKRALTFIAVAFAWIFFRANNLEAAIEYTFRMLTAGFDFSGWRSAVRLLELNIIEMVVILVGIIVIWAVDELCNRRRMHLPVLIQCEKNAVRYIIFYLLIIAIFVFGMYGPGYHAEQFIYMQF